MFLSVTLEFYTSEDVILSAGMPVDSTHKCSFIVSLESTGLISSKNEVLAFQKENSAYGVSLNLNLADRTIAVHRGVFGLDGVEDASEETLRFGSCSGAYIKLGAASVWGCFSINFHYKSAM